jgi:hypothetical protein
LNCTKYQEETNLEHSWNLHPHLLRSTEVLPTPPPYQLRRLTSPKTKKKEKEIQRNEEKRRETKRIMKKKGKFGTDWYDTSKNPGNLLAMLDKKYAI